MPQGRPSIPADIARQVLSESGHRCSACGSETPLELAHIIPWNNSKDHSSENLICLCANCHSRADKEEWGQKTLRFYKMNPWILRPRPEQTPHRWLESLINIAERFFRTVVDFLKNRPWLFWQLQHEDAARYTNPIAFVLLSYLLVRPLDYVVFKCQFIFLKAEYFGRIPIREQTLQDFLQKLNILQNVDILTFLASRFLGMAIDLCLGVLVSKLTVTIIRRPTPIRKLFDAHCYARSVDFLSLAARAVVAAVAAFIFFVLPIPGVVLIAFYAFAAFFVDLFLSLYRVGSVAAVSRSPFLKLLIADIVVSMTIFLIVMACILAALFWGINATRLDVS
jgi:HNH endonuclease